ncbi:hypothetical protein L1987_12828 [Smallanthus sonchifolius]|uniref:Uncharacterized protein n=1 Tax=Smallanthus sonchifolius TaxID=185202 RepID=A0ACB9JFR8_9ASTR|nr:hypothetical protein L1987_12828 [Smallanthus sonchifolius]
MMYVMAYQKTVPGHDKQRADLPKSTIPELMIWELTISRDYELWDLTISRDDNQSKTDSNPRVDDPRARVKKASSHFIYLLLHQIFNYM